MQPPQSGAYPPRGGSNPLQGGANLHQGGTQFPQSGPTPFQPGAYPFVGGASFPQGYAPPLPSGTHPLQGGMPPQTSGHPQSGGASSQVGGQARSSYAAGHANAPAGRPDPASLTGRAVSQGQGTHTRSPSPTQGLSQPPARHQTLPRTITFNGTGSWRAFYGKFKAFADQAQWSGPQRRNELYWCMEGPAGVFFTSLLDREPDLEVPDIVTRLEKRYACRDHPEALQMELANSKQPRDELTGDWAARVLDLATRAFPDYTERQVQSQAVLYFCQGCYDREAGAHALDHRPKTVEAARELVIWRKCAYQMVYSRTRKDVRATAPAPPPPLEDKRIYRLDAPVGNSGQSRSGQAPGGQRSPATSQKAPENRDRPGDREKQRTDGWRGVTEAQSALLGTLASQQAAQAAGLEKVYTQQTAQTARVDKLQNSVDHLIQVVSQLRPRGRSASPPPNLCYQCGKRGHFRRDCPDSPSVKSVAFMVDEDEESNCNGPDEEATPWPEQSLADLQN